MKHSNSRRSFMKACLGTGAVLGFAAASPAALTLLPGTANAAEGKTAEHTQTRLLMGTVVTITVSHRDSSFAHQSIEQAFAEIIKQESVFNRHDSATAISQLNAHGRLDGAPRELCALVSESLALGNRLNSFDITVAPLVDLMRTHANPRGEISLNRAELAEARALMDRNSVLVSENAIRLGKSGMAVTLDGIAKGAITDRASSVLRSLGATSHLINSGGDIYASGLKADGKAWRVGVTHPGMQQAMNKTGSEKLPAVCSLRNRAMATSGTYEAFYDKKQRFHHLIDPQNGQCQPYFSSVTVTAPSAKLADALATALSAMPEREARLAVEGMPNCAAFFIARDGRMHSSSRWV